MKTLPKATLVVASTLAAAAFGLAACNKTPDQSQSATQAAATPGPSVKGVATAELGEPPVPVSGRTDPEAVAMRDAYIKWVEEKAYPAGLKRPVPPDPRSTDPQAKAVWAKYALWRVADEEMAGKAALKAMEAGVDKPAGSRNYGHMADGLPQPPSEHK